MFTDYYEVFATKSPVRVEIWRAVLLKLIVWLNLKETVGVRARLVMACAGLFLVAAISSEFSGDLGSRADNRTAGWFVPEADRPLTHVTDRGRVESLLRGTQVITKQETLFESQRCLAQAIYFEARSEPLSGWAAVADVVINRALDARYPSTICGVVFQGEYRRHKCQFSFACDGLSDQAQNRRLWQRAMRLAGNKLIDFRAHPSTARATHYHADYVDPYWNQSMVRLTKIGRHIFYTDRASADF
jgi:hypothetical protein